MCVDSTAYSTVWTVAFVPLEWCCVSLPCFSFCLPCSFVCCLVVQIYADVSTTWATEAGLLTVLHLHTFTPFPWYNGTSQKRCPPPSSPDDSLFSQTAIAVKSSASSAAGCHLLMQFSTLTVRVSHWDVYGASELKTYMDVSDVLVKIDVYISNEGSTFYLNDDDIIHNDGNEYILNNNNKSY